MQLLGKGKGQILSAEWILVHQDDEEAEKWDREQQIVFLAEGAMCLEI